MRITELGGHSGCRILLCEMENGEVFVRKISSGSDYNARLKAQAEKQGSYRNRVILTPRILSVGVTDKGLYYFDMEYIHGITLAEYMKTVEVGRIRNIVEKITHSMIIDNGSRVDNTDAFHNKIEDLSGKLSKSDITSVDKGLRMLKRHCWANFVQTPCHGDLTLENIIVKNDQLYLIDFLDSFYDSWLLDVATLLQDVQMLWAYRNQERVDINALIRLIIFRDILIDETIRIAGSEFIVEIYYALLLKLVRICPYVKDLKTMTFLDEKIKSVIHIIEEVEA